MIIEASRKPFCVPFARKRKKDDIASKDEVCNGSSAQDDADLQSEISAEIRTKEASQDASSQVVSFQNIHSQRITPQDVQSQKAASQREISEETAPEEQSACAKEFTAVFRKPSGRKFKAWENDGFFQMTDDGFCRLLDSSKKVYVLRESSHLKLFKLY